MAFFMNKSKKSMVDNIWAKATEAFWRKEFTKGMVLGRYTLKEPIGSGKLGWAWSATSRDGEEVCLKISWTSSFHDQRVYAWQEFRALEALAPLGISPRPIEVYLTPWVSIIVMELIRGVSLDRHATKLPKEEYLRALAEVEPFFAMELPVWHEDMHLGNFMWDGKKVWLIDLGQARMPSEVGPVAQDNRARRVAQWKGHIEWVKQWK